MGIGAGELKHNILSFQITFDQNAAAAVGVILRFQHKGDAGNHDDHTVAHSQVLTSDDQLAHQTAHRSVEEAGQFQGILTGIVDIIRKGLEYNFLAVGHDLAAFDGHIHSVFAAEIIGQRIHTAHGDNHTIGRRKRQFGDRLVQPQIGINLAVVRTADGIFAVHGDGSGAVFGAPCSGNPVITLRIQCARKMKPVLALIALVVYLGFTHGAQFPGRIQIQQVVVRTTVNHCRAAVTDHIHGDNGIYLAGNFLGNILLDIHQAAVTLKGNGVGTVAGLNRKAVLTLTDRNRMITVGNRAVFRYGNIVVAAAGGNIDAGICGIRCVKLFFQCSVFLIIYIQIHIGRSGGADIDHIVTVSGVNSCIAYICQRDVNTVTLLGTIVGKVVGILNLHIHIAFTVHSGLDLTLIFLLLFQRQINTRQQQFHILDADTALQFHTAGAAGADRCGIHSAVAVGRNGINRIGCGSCAFFTGFRGFIAFRRSFFAAGFRARFLFRVFIGIVGNDIDDDAFLGITVFVHTTVVNDQAAGIGAVLHHNRDVFLTGCNGCVHRLLNGIAAVAVGIACPIAAAGCIAHCACGTAFLGSTIFGTVRFGCAFFRITVFGAAFFTGALNAGRQIGRTRGRIRFAAVVRLRLIRFRLLSGASGFVAFADDRCGRRAVDHITGTVFRKGLHWQQEHPHQRQRQCRSRGSFRCNLHSFHKHTLPFSILC